jgi:hypothetical protein
MMITAGGLTYYYGRSDSDTAYTVSTTASLLLGVGCVQDSGSFCAQQIYSIYTGDYVKVFQSGATQADAAAFCTPCKYRMLNTGILPILAGISLLRAPGLIMHVACEARPTPTGLEYCFKAFPQTSSRSRTAASASMRRRR